MTAPAADRLSDGIHPDRETLIQLRQAARGLPLHTRVTARSTVAGGYRSSFRGRGMDYLESRVYQAGDDIRNMDWRVTARTGRAHVKVYHEERERPVMVMADFGPRMFFATRGAFKTIIAARAAALIAWAAVDNGDRIGALLYNGKHRELRPAGGRRGALRLIHALVTAAQPLDADPRYPTTGNTGPGDTLGAALRRLRRVARPGSLVFIFSDFYTIGEDIRPWLQNLRRHHDVIACQILDQLELEPPPPGQYPVQGGKQQGLLDTRSSRGRQRWAEHFAARRRTLELLLRQCDVPLIRLATDDDVSGALRQTLGRSDRASAGLAA